MRGAWIPGVALIATAAAVGCGFSADLGGGHFRCQRDSECPDGVSCVEGICGGESPSSDASLTDAPATAVCPAGALLSDDFEGDRLDDARWMSWTEGVAAIGLAESRLDITAHASNEGGGVYSVDGVLLDESSLVVEVISPADHTSNTMGVELIDTGSSAAVVTFCRDNSDLIAKVDSETQPPEQSQTVYEPEKHRFWRIDEMGDDIHFATSADGSSWTELWVASSADLPAEIRLSLWGENYESVTPLVLSFGSATWCKMPR